MYTKNGELIYIGKAKSLKNRVKSYFQKNADHTPRISAMVEQIERFDYIVTDSEIEALILESNLIKQHTPKYNILARDDKKYPWIGIGTDAFPRVFVTRTPSVVRQKTSRAPRAKFFGPYTNSRDMYLVLEVIKKHFPLRQRKNPLFKNRPCMNYSIGTCPGPCQQLITPSDYQETVLQVELFLKGKADELLEILKADMEKASVALNFELAAKLRDRYKAVERMVATQKVFYQDDSINQDIISAVGDGLRCAFNILSIRRGKLIASRSHEIMLTLGSTVQEAYNRFVYEYYDTVDTDDLPHSLILQYPIEDEDILANWLTQRRKETASLSETRTLAIYHPEKGEKKKLLDMSLQNAQEALEKAQLYDLTRFRNDPVRALIDLQETLNLPDFPRRMECYDISHFQGGQTVASMVVFVNGVPDKSQYRRFKINTAEGKPDDFKSMAEVISRRFGNNHDWDEPDLVIIDGGKGQLSAAQEAIKAQGIHYQPMISLAKQFEEVFLPGESRPVLIGREAPALFLLQQIRDEAHRFAITYHRKLRDKKATSSVLDDIPGVGEKTKKSLLKAFGSVQKIKDASLDTLESSPVLNKRLAQAVYHYFHSSESSSL